MAAAGDETQIIEASGYVCKLFGPVVPDNGSRVAARMCYAPLVCMLDRRSKACRLCQHLLELSFRRGDQQPA